MSHRVIVFRPLNIVRITLFFNISYKWKVPFKVLIHTCYTYFAKVHSQLVQTYFHVEYNCNVHYFYSCFCYLDLVLITMAVIMRAQVQTILSWPV